VTDVQVLPNLTAFELAIHDFKSQLQAFAIARLQGLHIRFGDVCQVCAGRQWACGLLGGDLGCVKIKLSHDKFPKKLSYELG
jgi:hypothetical protein